MQNKTRCFIVSSVLLLLALLACTPASEKSAQDGLSIASGEPVKPGRQITFPQDHGIHPEQGIEWWYLTANLTAETGETFGVQWTLFRTLVPGQIESRWWDDNLYFAHFAIQHKQAHHAFERFARSEQAGVVSSPFSAFIDDWQLRSLSQDFLPLQLTAAETDHAVSLTLADSPVTFHGDKGYSQKTQSGHASYYYSYPFLKASGKVTFAGQTFNVNGHAWYDREWSASLLDEDQVGWDWFSLVDSNQQHGLMLFCIRTQAGSYDNCSGTRIRENGQAETISHQHINISVLASLSLGDKVYPQKWQVVLADYSPIIIEAITRDSRNQLTVPYWEGRIKASGGFIGKGYGEITGR
ncbi:lipocalin-like domain-containing protein [Alteromonas ponticola]|uniref:ABC transporter n=1 Tax=Alteromonas ponticola TaxID=2720613 RepID=A0ABX1R2N4_9ALTE|nr:lipocalin-like domain-containing protein [Alteromonas ponticola]NMH59881.1 ABC transporter [Alteromonas ponticola]